jgi:N-acetylglutamate synthase (EC 2.3.1.1)
MSLNNTPLQGAHINVVSGNFIIAQPLGVDDGIDYCHSGRIRRIDEEAIHRQLDSGAIVLMGPVAVSVTGESFNLTSEEIATQLAIKLKAEKMIGFCSSQGVMNADGNIISELFPNEAQARVETLETEGDYYSGTVRFLRGAVKACRSGVRRCHLISYQENGASVAGTVLPRRHRHADSDGERRANSPRHHQRHRRDPRAHRAA